MESSLLDEVLSHWGRTLGLRHVPALNRYRGVVDGVAMDAWVEEFRLNAFFFAPGANLVSQVAGDFAGFEQVAATGVPKGCLAGAVSASGLNEHACVLRLTESQIQTLDPDQFLRLPAAVARDFHACGADPEALRCSVCDAADPDEFAEVRGEYVILCDTCLGGIQRQLAASTSPANDRVNWPRTIPALLLSTLFFSWIWGWLQDPQVGLDLLFLVAIPLGGVFVHAWLVTQAAGGTNSTLIWSIFVSSMVAVLSGNIRGFQIHCAINQIPLTWNEAAWLYLTHHLRESWSTEILYFAGAIVGLYFVSASARPSPENLARRL